MRSTTEKLSLTRDFFARPADVVAPELLGAELIVDAGTKGQVVARVVEVEAYLGADDSASHAYRGPTKRSAIMFGPAGRLYVYLSYGMHHCVNVVTGVDGVASAVLLRAAEVVSGIQVVRARRNAPSAEARALLSGPGNLGKGLGLSLSDNGVDLVEGPSRISCRLRGVAFPIERTPRIGISSAVEAPLRFVLSGHPAASAGRSQRVCVD